MTSTDASALSTAFNDIAYDVRIVADQLSSINSIAEGINDITHIFLAPDQVIHTGNDCIHASELVLMQRLLKETYPEEFL